MAGKVLSSGGWDSHQSVSTKLRHGAITLIALFAILSFVLFPFTDVFAPLSAISSTIPQGNLHTPVFDTHKETILSRCAALKITPGPPTSFRSRGESDRYEPGTNATLIRNAVIFTGRDQGNEVVSGDILLDKGLVKGMGKISWRLIENTPNLTIVDAKGAWVTPGLGMALSLTSWHAWLKAITSSSGSSYTSRRLEYTYSCRYNLFFYVITALTFSSNSRRH